MPNDLVVIHVRGDRPPQSSGVKAGEIVFAFGNPLGLQSSVTQGIVSSINRKVNEGDGVTLSDVLQPAPRSTRATPAAHSATRRRPGSASRFPATRYSRWRTG